MKTYLTTFSLIIIVSLLSVRFTNLCVENKLCFELEDKLQSNYIEIIFLGNNEVKGILDVYIHDEEMGYETSSFSEFTGSIEGEKISVELIIEIEGNIENQSETWIYKGNYLEVNDDTYILSDCRKN